MQVQQRVTVRSRTSTVRVNALFKSTVVSKTTKQTTKQAEEKKTEAKGLSGVIEALDFAAPRSAQDAEALYNAKQNWKKGESKLSREEYAALARKIRGSYKDYFKEYVEEERVENTYYKPDAATGTVPYLPLLVGIVGLMLVATVAVVQQTS